MTSLTQRIRAFSKLGLFISDCHNALHMNTINVEQSPYATFIQAVRNAKASNLWFTDQFIWLSLKNIAAMLNENQLKKWTNNYHFNAVDRPKIVGVVMAGNIPLVGFHDFLCILLSGHTFLGKLSSSDQFLIPALAAELCRIEPNFASSIQFTQDKLEKFDAVIATGSGNSARYFDYYFGKYPHIIRRNRNSIAIINGDENENDFEQLAQDIFTYFGLGCRSVSMVYVPKGFDVTKMYPQFETYQHFCNHNKYFNNYEYNKSIFLINKIPHFDNGFLLLKQDEKYGSAISVLHYSYYENVQQLQADIDDHMPQIQCIVSKNGWWEGSVPFGQAQNPGVSMYADGVDTLQFLLELEKKS